MIVVVGAGISGVACARALVGHGHEVRVLDRGRRIGGRLALRTVPGEATGGADRVVDVGGSYATASDPGFRGVVEGWVARGLAREWTDTFHVVEEDGSRRTSSGPVRYAAAGGLRSLVEDLAAGLDVAHPVDVTGIEPGEGGGWTVRTADEAGGPLRADAVVVAAPDPQAARILPEDVVAGMRPAGPWPWDPVVALAAAWPERWWAEVDGVFVNGHPALTWIADDGRRRGDGAPVLVAHSTPDAARGWLADPDEARAPLLAALAEVLAPGAQPPEPAWAHVQRWTFSQPRRDRPAPPYLLTPGLVGVCGDAWGERSSVEGAWLSGTRLGDRLAGDLR